jgi:thiol-disulfide isomerase/thioredoxin
MDRLSVVRLARRRCTAGVPAAVGGRRLRVCVALIVLAVVACDEPAAKEPAAGEARVNAVMASGKKQSFADLCDLAPEPGTKPFVWPGLASPAPPLAAGARFRWVNVWATWCKPCIEELPLLTKTFETWKKAGQSVDFTLVSVDADAAAAKSFIAARPGTPASLQLSDSTKAGDWLTQIGLASGASIPVHTILDDRGNLLCARAGGVGETHLERFKQLLFP